MISSSATPDSKNHEQSLLQAISEEFWDSLRAESFREASTSPELHADLPFPPPPTTPGPTSHPMLPEYASLSSLLCTCNPRFASYHVFSMPQLHTHYDASSHASNVSNASHASSASLIPLCSMNVRLHYTMSHTLIAITACYSRA